MGNPWAVRAGSLVGLGAGAIGDRSEEEGSSVRGARPAPTPPGFPHRGASFFAWLQLRFSKIVCLGRIDDTHRKASLIQAGGERDPIAPCRFHHNEDGGWLDPMLLKPPLETFKALGSLLKELRITLGLGSWSQGSRGKCRTPTWLLSALVYPLSFLMVPHRALR